MEKFGTKDAWCKVLWSANISSNKGSLTAVWLHNNAENNGYAQQINRVPSSIAGAEPRTSWLFYSRGWLPSEEEHVKKAIDKIIEENPDAAGDIPFKEMKSILKVSHHSKYISHREEDLDFLKEDTQFVLKEYKMPSEAKSSIKNWR